MITLNPLNLYTKATNPTIGEMGILGEGGKEIKVPAIHVTAGKTNHTVIFDFEKNQYQILNAPRDNGDKPVFGEKGAKITLAINSQFFGVHNENRWKKITKEIAEEDKEAIANYACTVIEQRVNSKATRFFAWTTRPLVNLTLIAYNHPLAGKTAKWAVAIAILCGGYAFWTSNACQTSVQAPSRILEYTKLDRIILWASRFPIFNRFL